MRLVKTFSSAMLVTAAVMGLVGVTSPSANTSTQLCKAHMSLTCGEGNAATAGHMTLSSGTVAIIKVSGLKILCLGFLLEATPLGLGNPQTAHATAIEPTGCGTSSTHSNCVVWISAQPLSNLLKTGLDEGVLIALSGTVNYACVNIGINCAYDLEGAEFSVAANHFTAEETPLTELGGKFLCSDTSYFSGLLKALDNAYVLG